MASNGGADRLFSGKDELNCSETTVEIKIKTLDSQTYTMRVDKCVPVPALKEQIASLTGVLSEQQRLICRGKVLMDDQLLSAYHVEDGHTLHLVVRQPVATSTESSPNPDGDPASTSGRSQDSGGPAVVVGSFNISEQDGALDMSRVLSAVLGSFGMANFGSGIEGIDLNELPPERFSNAAGLRNLGRQRPDLPVSGQSVTDSGAFSLPVADSVESLQAPVIPDSLATLSHNLRRLRQEFIANGEAQSNSNQAAAGIRAMGGQNLDATSFSTVERGLPTPATLADVLLTARQLLNEQVAECLSQLARQLEGQASVTDAPGRARIQNNALRSGALFHNLGALLLELARTTITLRMGQSPSDAIVNAGPAVFISAAGPNPIMVQPLSFQPGIGFGATGGTVQQGSGLAAGSGGSGVFPRNIDIRIRRVAVPSAANRRESARSQNLGSTDPAASMSGNSAQEAAARGSGGSAIGESELRLFPIRTVFAAVPAQGGPATSEPSRGTMGILFPLLARVQRFTAGGTANTRTAQASDQPHAPAVDTASESIPDPAIQLQSLRALGVDGSSGSLSEQVDGPGLPAQLFGRIEQWLRTVLPGEHHHTDSGIPQGTEANPVTGHVGNAQNENSEAAAATDEGTFLSNLLQQLIPLISENGGSGSNNTSSSEANTSDDRNNRQEGTEGQGSRDRGCSSQPDVDDDPSLEPAAKRQKRE